jgi:hypothetical protein
MLRRRPDDTYELLFVEQALWAARPVGLTAERREGLRLRILSALGRQEEREARVLALPTERWVAIPAGVGILAAILGAARLAEEMREALGSVQHASPVPAGPTNDPLGRTWTDSGSMSADQPSWAFAEGVAAGLNGGASFDYDHQDGELRVSNVRGALVLGTDSLPVVVEGGHWHLRLAPKTAAQFDIDDAATRITAVDGTLSVHFADGSFLLLAPGESTTIPAAPGSTESPAGDSGADSGTSRALAPSENAAPQSQGAAAPASSVLPVTVAAPAPQTNVNTAPPAS